MIGKNAVAAALDLAALTSIGANSAFADGRATVTAATGGSAIPADTAGGAWTTLTGPILKESDAGGGGGHSGTIVLTAPTGFALNPNAGVSVLVQKTAIWPACRPPSAGNEP